MKDPGAGGISPDFGASSDEGPETKAAASASGSERTNAALNPNEAAKGAADARESQPSKRRKRRRKRRRGRKVYANGAAQPETAAAVPPGEAQPVGAQKEPVVSRDRPHASAHNRSRQAGAGNTAQPRPCFSAPAYAALDLGTNNCRLLVAVPTRPGQFRVIDAYSRIVRLGEGLSASGRLGDQAMERALEALALCAVKLDGRKIRKARLIATEACRAAENGSEFLSRVKERTGLELEIVDRETEARLAVSGCSSLVERDTSGVVLFDIGGGSSEIALIDIQERRSPHLANHIVSWTSLPVGVVSLAERFGGRHVTPEIFEAMIADVLTMIASFEDRDRLAHIVGGDRFHLLGTSGTVTTLAGIYLNLERYDRRRVDGIWLDDDHVTSMTERLLGWDFATRVANPCIGADRADLVLAGCAILEAIRRTWPSQRLRVADRGLREGMLIELMTRDNVWRRRPRHRRSVQS